MESYEPTLLMKIYYDAASNPISAGESVELKYKDYLWRKRIEDDEVAEVLGFEIIPPEDPTTKEAVGNGYLTLMPDGKEIEKEHLRIPLNKEINVCPIKDRVEGKRAMFVFGRPIADLLRTGQTTGNLLEFLCPHFKDKFDMTLYCTSDINQPFTILVWGYIYPEEIIDGAGITLSVDSHVEPYRKATYPIGKSIAVTSKNWTKLPNGKEQDNPKIFTFLRYSTNSNNITTVEDYYMSEKDENVPDNCGLYWYSDETKSKMFIFTHLGLRYNANVDRVSFKDTEGHYHPKRGMYPWGTLDFGWSYGVNPARQRPKEWGTYFLLPKLFNHGFAETFTVGFKTQGVEGEEGGVVINAKAGTTIAANSLKMVARGIYIVWA